MQRRVDQHLLHTPRAPIAGRFHVCVADVARLGIEADRVVVDAVLVEGRLEPIGLPPFMSAGGALSSAASAAGWSPIAHARRNVKMRVRIDAVNALASRVMSAFVSAPGGRTSSPGRAGGANGR